jgi:hypothetical protein
MSFSYFCYKGESNMKLKPIQLAILLIQIAAILLNLYGVFIKGVQDYGAHIIAIFLIATMMMLSIKSWKSCNTKLF